MSLNFDKRRVHLPTSRQMSEGGDVAEGVGECLNMVPSHTRVLIANQGNEYETDVI
jgi:hypothetical protein